MLPPKSGNESNVRHSRSHFNFSGNPTSLPNKLKNRARQGKQQGYQSQALEKDAYNQFLKKKQAQM